MAPRPARYEHWLRVTADSLADVRSEENYLFILAWNEWAEGNHLEPDQRYGRAFLEATRSVLLDGPSTTPTDPPSPRTVGGRTIRAGETDTTWHDRSVLGEVVANVVGLLAELELPAGRQVVDLADQDRLVARRRSNHPASTWCRARSPTWRR